VRGKKSENIVPALLGSVWFEIKKLLKIKI